MRDELAELNRELALELAARVGINSGEAVAETTHASEAASKVRGPEDISGVAEAEWVRAHVLAARSDDDAADAAFSAALASAEQGEFLHLQATLLLDRAEFLITRKRASEAAKLLEEVERRAPPPPWNFLPTRRRALAAAVEAQRV
jgi:hypothetical protein